MASPFPQRPKGIWRGTYELVHEKTLGAGQPLGVNSGDNVTWNNRTNQEIKLQSIQPAEPPPVFPFNSIPAQAVSNPIFNVTETIGYSWVRPQVVAAKSHAARKRTSPGPARGATPEPAPPDAWIVVV
jgi:hypothetical protein